MLVVAAIGSIVFARRVAAPDLRIQSSVAGTPTPTVEQRDPAAREPQPQASFRGQGTWAMSSLPDCFRELERTRGALTKLQPAFPPEAQRLPPATVVRRGACTIVVGEHDLWIARGNDRLRVPPEARLYRSGERLTLVTITGRIAEIRTY